MQAYQYSNFLFSFDPKDVSYNEIQALHKEMIKDKKKRWTRLMKKLKGNKEKDKAVWKTFKEGVE
jgi:hypothetical protein